MCGTHTSFQGTNHSINQHRAEAEEMRVHGGAFVGQLTRLGAPTLPPGAPQISTRMSSGRKGRGKPVPGTERLSSSPVSQKLVGKGTWFPHSTSAKHRRFGANARTWSGSKGNKIRIPPVIPKSINMSESDLDGWV